jgi:probable O-glycosylation ligase (exosortase A-associated)
MRDLAFIAFLLALFGAGFRRPFLFVLAYVYIDIVSPQRLTYYLLNSIQISLIAVVLAVGGWAIADNKTGTRIAPRQIMIAALIAYCFCTTLSADFPAEASDKWGWVWKSLAFAAFLPFTLRTRLRIEALLLFMILSASSIIIVGGAKTIASGGGGYGSLNLMVANNSGLYEGSTISAVAVAIVPLILWFTRYGTVYRPDWKVKGFAYALIFSCLLIPVGTSTRTGLLCIGLLAVLMLRDVERKLPYLIMLAVIGGAAVPMLPSSFTDRMSTIKTYQADSSASTRIAVWAWTREYARQHPFGGGFEAYRGNHIRYDTVAVSGTGAATTVKSTLEVDAARAYHSAYFEMLGEQGYPGLALWLLINLIGLIRMEVVRRRYIKDEDGGAWAGRLAEALQHAQLIYLLGGAFVGIAFQSYLYFVLGAQIGLDTYMARLRKEAAFVPPNRRRPARVAQAAA